MAQRRHGEACSRVSVVSSFSSAYPYDPRVVTAIRCLCSPFSCSSSIATIPSTLEDLNSDSRGLVFSALSVDWNKYKARAGSWSYKEIQLYLVNYLIGQTCETLSYQQYNSKEFSRLYGFTLALSCLFHRRRDFAFISREWWKDENDNRPSSLDRDRQSLLKLWSTSTHYWVAVKHFRNRVLIPHSPSLARNQLLGSSTATAASNFGSFSPLPFSLEVPQIIRHVWHILAKHGIHFKDPVFTIICPNFAEKAKTTFLADRTSETLEGSIIKIHQHLEHNVTAAENSLAWPLVKQVLGMQEP